MRRFFKILIFILGFLLLVVSCSFGVYKYKVSQSGSLDIVIIGTDLREGEDSARSDTLMIAHVDEEHNRIDLISIPRDAYVYIPSVNREDKITHAFAYNQREGTMETLDYLFETEFKYYIELNFEKMIRLVDSIDGIELTPTASFCEMDENDNAQSYCFEEGVAQQMNGSMALSYSRHRKSDSDLFRAQRQQEVVKAMVAKVKQKNLLEMYNFYNNVKEISETNLDLWELIGYMDMAFNTFELTQEVAEGYSDMVYSNYYGQEISYFFLDEQWVQEKINLFRK